MGVFDRLPQSFVPGDIFQLGRGGRIVAAGTHGASGQFLQLNSSGLWVPHTLVLGDVGSVFDATAPTTSAVGDAAAAGSAGVAAERDHKHGRETNAWTSVAYSSGNFGASGGGTWTVDSGDQLTYVYVQIGKTMVIAFNINATTIAGVVSALTITLPNSQTAARRVDTAIVIRDNGVAALGQAFVQASGTAIGIVRGDVANFTVCTNNTQVVGAITFETT